MSKKFQKKKSAASEVDAEFRIKIEKEIEKFVHHSNEMFYEFPPSLTNVERAFVHNLAPNYNLKTKSEGQDENRRIKLFKPTENDDFTGTLAKITLDAKTIEILKQYTKEFSSHNNNIQSKQPTKKKSSKSMVLAKKPAIPPPSNCDQRIYEKRMQLPIFSYRQRILQAIDENRILLIQGSTGSGKTTQIPQFILEKATERNQACRILCTQPRRITAIASSERVCYERCELATGSVGYQIRLESTISQETNCIFLTPGVFLRYLTSDDPDKLFNNITHILIDEAHERAKENDFLLTSIKENFNANPNLRLIIMSATMDTAVFSNYFGGCEEIAISVKQFNVDELYLEDILKLVGFFKNNRAVEELDVLHKNGKLTMNQSSYVKDEEVSYGDLDEETISHINEVLDSMNHGNEPENELEQFLYLVQAENVPVDIRHASTKMTALMIAIGRSCFNGVETLLKLNANPNLKVQWNETEISCLDIATQLHGAESDVAQLVQRYTAPSSSNLLSSQEVYNKALLNIYYNMTWKTANNSFVVEEGIDHELIAQLIEKLHNTQDRNEAILVFLPGYDDIIRMSNLITSRIRDGYTMFMLHSSMKTDDQKNVFKPVMYGSRKIILSTNIAESSITIDDVVYVIDSGREKQKSYDAMSHSSSLKVQWISKASANQRKGRAGRLRNGFVYRVYSKDRFESMSDTTLPELLRSSLTEICLQTKLMINENLKIEEFLLKCITPPSLASIRQSIKLLQSLGALDKHESLTQLGTYLAQMPVDAKYGKMLIYAIALKCLDPVLSIVSILSMSDQIFVLPFRKDDRVKCQEIRQRLSDGSMSDHFFMLKIFQMWLNQSSNRGSDRRFCEEHFISSSSMEHVRGIRSQILSYLQKSDLANSSMNVLNTNSSKWPVVKTCLCAGLYPSVARINKKKKKIYSDIDAKLSFHMSSVMCSKNDIDFKAIPADWVVFEEKNRVRRNAMIRCNTLTNSFTLSLAAGASLESILEQSYHDQEESVFKIDNLVTFSALAETGALLLKLRGQFDGMITRFVTQCLFKHNENDDRLVETVVVILELEDLNSGFVPASLEPNFTSTGNNYWRQPPNFANQKNFDQSNQRQRGFEQAGNRQWSYDQPRNFQRASTQSNERQNYQKHQKPLRDDQRLNQSSSTFFANNSPNQARHQQQHNRIKYVALKMNSDSKITKWAQKIILEIDELNLSSFFLQKLEKLIFNETAVVIIFFSTNNSEFLGFGEVMRPNAKNEIQFHFKHLHKLSLARFVENSMMRYFSIFQNHPHSTEELSDEVGRKIVKMLQES